MSHVAPTRWADLAAGRLADGDRRRALAHADRCPACARARDRITAASSAMNDIARTPPPELGWDHIRARVYWAVSSERRSQQRRAAGRGRHVWLMAPMAVAVAAALFVLGGRLVPDQHRIPVVAVPAPVARPIRSAPVPPPLTGVVTAVAGDIDIDGAVDLGDALARRITAGSVLRTRAGRVGVQFGAGSAFSVGAGSTVDVRRFDSEAIELAVQGELAVEVSKRLPGQRFTVIVGGRSVEVRGTAFRVVQHEQSLEVACSHGRVAVIDRSGAEIEVGAGEMASIFGDGDSLLTSVRRPLAAAALEALAASQAPRLPAWTDIEGMYRTSNRLDVVVAPGRAVRVDGVAVGRGALTLRVMSGRYLVEVERSPGHWGDPRWIEVDGSDNARLEVVAAARSRGRGRVIPAEPPPPEPTTADARDQRMAQLEKALDRGRAAACLRALTKQGIGDTYLELEVGIDASGAVSFLNIAGTDLPRSMAACVRDVVAAVRFPAGAAATWRHRITF